MLFNSFEFLLFFPVVTVLYFLLPHKWRWLHLLLASCAFYMALIPVYIFILLFTIVIDYFAGIIIDKSEGRKRKIYLIVSILANVGVLAVFKYYNFFIENVNELFGFSGTQDSIPYLNIILPVGLSFHTFQAMSYTIEIYRRNQKAEKHFGIYALYVMFYPQLVAGPIERPQNLLHQFREKHSYEINRVYDGLRLMLWGLFKKVVIADRLSLYVNTVYGDVSAYSGGNLAVATVFFAIQIYCDFSGYSDMAIGSAQVMGFDLMKNFHRPYFAKNIQEFWKRWHISLSTWFRDYVYISMGGNRVSKARIYFNVAIVFLLSGFWHGANWTFIVWGAVHAFLIICYMLYKEYFNSRNRDGGIIGQAVSIIITFALVCVAWIFFRAQSVGEACTIISKIIHTSPADFEIVVKGKDIMFGVTSILISVVMIFLLFFNDYYQDTRQRLFNAKPFADIAYNGVILFLIIGFGVFQKTSFIYFQF
jgi:alginate O-acetyltransferase complex protein AlgI